MPVHGQKGGVTASAVVVVQLRGQHHARHHRRAHRLPVGQHRTQLPLQQAQHAPALGPGRLLVQRHGHVLHRVHRVHPPPGLHRQPGVLVGDRGATGLLRHGVVGIGRAGAGAQRPGLAARQGLQAEGLAGHVGQRVVAPGRQLVQPAVASPAAPCTRLGHQRAKAGVGQHVDPGPRHRARRAGLEAVAAVHRIERPGAARRGGLGCARR